MPIKEHNKFLIPVEVIQRKPNKWFNIKTFEYKLYSDNSESKHTIIKFIDFNGFIVGEHMPTKLLSIYDKAAIQMKNTTVKAVSDIKNAVDGVADITIAAATEVSQEVSKTAKQTAGMAVGLLEKLTSFAKSKIKKDDQINQ